MLDSHWLEWWGLQVTGITSNDMVDVSMAVSTDKGLITPIIKGAEIRGPVSLESLTAIAASEAILLI